jgi:hypothetical protein
MAYIHNACMHGGQESMAIQVKDVPRKDPQEHEQGGRSGATSADVPTGS